MNCRINFELNSAPWCSFASSGLQTNKEIFLMQEVLTQHSICLPNSSLLVSVQHLLYRIGKKKVELIHGVLYTNRT